MGFMDKAKKLAEQAQEKLDEAQKQFNQSGSSQQGEQSGGARYDEHGRPVEDPPAGAAAPPAAEPQQAGAEEPTPKAEERKDPPPGTDANPDPFKPIQ
jgi:hypothetical protein